MRSEEFVFTVPLNELKPLEALEIGARPPESFLPRLVSPVDGYTYGHGDVIHIIKFKELRDGMVLLTIAASRAPSPSWLRERGE